MLKMSISYINLIRCKIAGLSRKRKTCKFFMKKSVEKFGSSEKSRTFASAFAQKRVKH